jgi:phenylacetic acid degradation operon negative regulatory protein
MELFGFNAQTVRTTVSRMVDQGWLERFKEGKNSIYSLTLQGQETIAQGVLRIFDIHQEAWDENWLIVTYNIPENQRNIRDELRRELNWLGFGALSAGSWISPWNIKQLIDPFVKKYKLQGQVECFLSRHEGYSSDQALGNRCWKISSVAEQYQRFLDVWQTRLEEFEQVARQPLDYFKMRVELVHEWRKFLHIDPKLPYQLLPENWIGKEATLFFEKTYQMLKPRADQYFLSVVF